MTPVNMDEKFAAALRDALVEQVDAIGGETRRKRRARSTRQRLAGATLPVASAAVVAIVVGAIVVLGHSGQHVSPGGAGSTTPAFTGGMRGVVDVYGARFDGDFGTISLLRCSGCSGSHLGPDSYWQATTDDGGRSWQLARRQKLVYPPLLGAGENLWASGNRPLARAPKGGGPIVSHDGGRTEVGAPLVSHDGGRSWTAVDLPGLTPYAISEADGVVWTLRAGCNAPCGQVRRGPASGSELTPVRSMPAVARRVSAQIVALGATSAYLYAAGAVPHRAWVTADGGSTWKRVPLGCPSEVSVGDGHGAIWRDCGAFKHGGNELGVSTDGGRHWTYHAAPFRETGALYPASARVAWVMTESGATMRTTDGGRSWQTVWSTNDAQLASGDRAGPSSLNVQSATTATEVVPVIHTDPRTHHALTNLVVYRTTDGGAHWQPSAVGLPHG